MPAADLYPISFETLVHRMDRELREGKGLYEMPKREWWIPDSDCDVSLQHLGKHLATPAGPASGPHTQLAQNLVLSFLAGGRFMELKTVQVNDALEIPRPCIHVPNIGYNVEWSQELRVPQSAEEYVKGWMLIHMLCSEHGPGHWGGVDASFDVSLGYDLAGIRTQKVRDFLEVMKDASALMSTLRSQLPARLRRWAEVAVPSEVSNSITLSTFHGCPAEEIEAIASQTLDWGWHTVVKLNPTLLGFDAVRGLLDGMGYEFVRLDRHAFDMDLQWEQLRAMAPRLAAKASEKGLGWGFKLTNTLVCHSPDTPFYPENDGEGEMYLSGPPLHVVAAKIAAKLREELGNHVPLTFSAGVDRENFRELIAGGLGPVTSCSDLLKGRGYGRMSHYVRRLEKHMKSLGAENTDAYRLALVPQVSEPSEAGSRWLADYADRVDTAPAVQADNNQKAPKKVGTGLELLDCLTCDKCIPVCPNNANFGIDIPMGSLETEILRWEDGALTRSLGQGLEVAKRHQLGTIADVCNSCGQCDPWCPEDGGPYLVKPNLFLSREAFEEHPDRHGFWINRERSLIEWRTPAGPVVQLERRRDGLECLTVASGTLILRGKELQQCTGQGELDTSVLQTLRLYLSAFAEEQRASWLPPKA